MMRLLRVNPRNSRRGWMLPELLVALPASALLLVAAYRISTHVSQTSAVSTRATTLSQKADFFQRRLEKTLLLLGYNPRMVPYPVCTGGTASCARASCDPDAADHRIGLVSTGFSGFEFTSDDNELVVPDTRDCATGDSTCPSGKIQPGERYELWVANGDGTKLTFEGLTDPSAGACTPKSGTAFDMTYKLYGKIKAASVSNPADLYAKPTEPTVLAENVLCFEVRYYRKALPTETPLWVPLCPYSTAPKSSYCPASGEVLPPGPHDDGFNEENYYTRVRDDLRRIEVTVLLKLPDGTTKRVTVNNRLANPPWTCTQFASLLPGSAS